MGEPAVGNAFYYTCLVRNFKALRLSRRLACMLVPSRLNACSVRNIPRHPMAVFLPQFLDDSGAILNSRAVYGDVEGACLALSLNASLWR